MASKIGIKLADGTFFPIMDEEPSAFETLELTTVRDDQESVQINLFKKEDDTEPEYIESLVIEDIQQKVAGDATIALRLSMDEEKNLSAEALDVDSGSRQALKVALRTFDEVPSDTVDFDLNESTEEEEETEDQFSPVLLYSDDEKETEKKRGMPVWLIVLLVLLGIAALVLAVLLLTKKDPSIAQSETSGTTIIENEAAPAQDAVSTNESEPVTEPEKTEQKNTLANEPELPPDTPVTEPPVPLDEQTSVADGSSAQSADEIPASSEPVLSNAVRHKLLWGDTLWDLSETYYRNPWLYKKIAEHNNLKTPDMIIAGTYIEIPAQ